MQYISISEAAEKWGLTVRRVQDLCRTGLIPDAARFGRAWMIPADALRPADGRTKAAKAVKPPDDGLPHLPMPRKNPILISTDLYHTPGTADEAVDALARKHPEAGRLLRAQFRYMRGNIDDIAEDAQYFLKAHSGFNAVVSGGNILSKCAIWRGDLLLWRQARQHIYEAPCATEQERQALSFWIAATDSLIHDTHDFPEWFKRGVFDCLPADTHGSARVFHLKFLHIWARELASGKITLPDVNGLGLMRTLPYIVEPMLCQAKVERTLLAQIYLHLIAAAVYHDIGENERAIPHLDEAIALCLPDGLVVPLLEYRTALDTLLDDRLARADPDCLRRLRELHARMMSGWVRLHNLLLERNVSTALTIREREVAKLAAYGLANSEIAARLHIELSSVKRYIFSAMNKVGAEKRTELGQFI